MYKKEEMYKFKKDYLADGYFTELMDDNHPWIGSIRRNICKNFKEGELLIGCECAAEKFEVSSSNYGVSIHGSTTYLKISVEKLVEEGVLEKVADENYTFSEAGVKNIEAYCIANLGFMEWCKTLAKAGKFSTYCDGEPVFFSGGQEISYRMYEQAMKSSN